MSLSRTESRRHGLVRAVAHGLRHRCGVTTGTRLLAAVSGGADSVALLRALHLLADRRTWRLRLVIGHVQHHLRDADGSAEADAAFVAELASSLQSPLLRRDLDWSTADAGPDRNIESRARRMRYAALAEMAAECHADYVATAHHADDQFETVLMRLLRGAGVGGLAGIAWRRPLPAAPLPGPAPAAVQLLRPMLHVTRDQVLDFLRQIDQPWREDATNADVSRVRARLRREVLPVLRAMRPDAAHRAGHLAEHCRDVQRVLLQAVDDAGRRIIKVEKDGGRLLDRREAAALPQAVLMQMLRRTLRRLGVPADALGRRALEPLQRAIVDDRGGVRRFPFRQGVTATLTREHLRLARSPGPDPV